MYDKNYNEIKVRDGDVIRAVLHGGKYNNSILECNGGFSYDLSDWVTVKNVNGILRAGVLSIESYYGRMIEKRN